MTERWRKAARSAAEANCVEVSNSGLIRDSKNLAGPVLRVDLAGLLAAIKADGDTMITEAEDRRF